MDDFIFHMNDFYGSNPFPVVLSVNPNFIIRLYVVLSYLVAGGVFDGKALIILCSQAFVSISDLAIDMAFILCCWVMLFVWMTGVEGRHPNTNIVGSNSLTPIGVIKSLDG